MQKFSFAHPFPTGRFDSNNRKTLQHVAFIQFLCVQKYSYPKEFGYLGSLTSFSLSFLQHEEMQIFLICRCILFWLSSTVLCSPIVLITETGFSEKAERAQQPTGQWFLSTLETAASIPPGPGGNHTGTYGQIPLTQIPRLTNSLVLFPLTPTQTLDWRHHSKLDSAFEQNRNISPGNSDCWH